MSANKSVIIYGAGFRGGANFLKLAKENVHVEAFCDKDADNIPLYYGCSVLNCKEAITRYPTLPYIVSIDDENARTMVFNHLKESGMEVYESFEAFFQGLKDVEAETVFCGERGIGFQIIPILLGENKEPLIAYSFGIGSDFSFEMELVQKYGADVYAFDPSPWVIKKMEKQDLPKKFIYYPYGLSNEDSLKTFYQPSCGECGGDYSEYFAPWTSSKKIQMQVYRLSTIMERLGHNHLNLLKMDVEGSEFMALPDILNTGIMFDQLCIEMHTRIFPDSVEKMRGMKRLLNQHGYLMVSNGEQEQTYINEDMLKKCIL